MKTAPGFDAVVGHSHAVNTKVEVRQADDTPVGELPITGGTVSASAGFGVGVWAATIDVAGLSWAPATASDPLSPLSGHYLSVQRSAQLYGHTQEWVEVARVWPMDTTVTIDRGSASLRVDCASAADYAADAADLTVAVPAGRTCQVLAADLLSAHLPYTPARVDTSTPVTAPVGKVWENANLFSILDDLQAAGNFRLFIDAQGRIIMRPPLDALDAATRTVAPLRNLSVDLDITRYELSMSRGAFANEVQARFTDDSSNPSSVSDGGAAITAGPLRVDGPAGRIVYKVSKDVAVDQVAANAYAFSVLTAVKQGWVTVTIDAVQDPRLEPWDIFEATYLDRTLRHRVVSVQFDLGTGAMTLTARTTVPDGTTQQQAQATTHGNPHAGGKP